MDILSKWEHFTGNLNEQDTLSSFALVFRPRLYDVRFAPMVADTMREKLFHAQFLRNVSRAIWPITNEQLLTFLAIVAQDFSLKRGQPVDKVLLHVCASL